MNLFGRLNLALALAALLAVASSWAQPLDPATLTKYVDEVPRPGVIAPVGTYNGAPYYEITMTEFQQQLHSELPPTTLWGYHGTYPGPTIETEVNQEIWVRWINDLPTDHLFGIDTTLHGNGYPNPEVRTVVHLHGGNTAPEFDGYPEDWFTPGNNALYNYPNRQRAATLWYHDHALGVTGANVMTGLAAFYLLRDRNEQRLNLPRGNYEIPIALQDRSFNQDGSLIYPETWEPEFFGDVAVVNGKVWPRLTVEARKYRFRFLDGSNARFYNLKLLQCDANGVIMQPEMPAPAFYQIGTDQGFLEAPVALNDPENPESPRLLMGPGERADVIIDFAGYAGQYFILHNNAKAPFKGLDSEVEDEAPLPEILLVAVTPSFASDNGRLPKRVGNIRPLREGSAVQTRDLTLNEVTDEEGNPIMALLNNAMWDDPVTETPQLNTVEIWRIVNLTEDVHPIHLHLVKFQVLDRQPFDVNAYEQTGQIVFTGNRVLPDPNEMGWKDTFRAPPGYVSRLITRFEDYTGRYVWHCHILEHEDNQMMRPFDVLPEVAGLSESPGPKSPEPVSPAAFGLAQNLPNPFNPVTSISFTLSEAGPVHLTVFNALGQQVATLVDGEMTAGRHSVSFDGSALASGLYIYRIEAGSFTTQRKMLLMK